MLKRRRSRPLTTLILAAAGFVAVSDGCGVSSSDAPAERSEPVVTFGNKEDSANLTRAHYEEVRSGMSYDQVVGIVGTPGELIGEEDYEGNPRMIYQWNNYEGGNMVCTFKNDGLVKKVQMGLQ